MLLSEGIYLWKLSMNTKSLFHWEYGFCYISSVLKRHCSKERIACSSFSDQELRFAITNYIVYLVHPYLWFPFTYCKFLSYKGKLPSIIPCALVNVMLLVCILIIDTSLHKSLVMFTEFRFRLGTSEVSAWRWYLCCFLCFYMFDNHWRICCRSQVLEKGLSRHHILEDQEIPKKYQKIIFY
jgi:hypothetical protein